MKKILNIIGCLLFSTPIFAKENMIDMGDGVISDSIIEPIVNIVIDRSIPVMKILILISIMLIVLDIVFTSLNALIQEKYTNFVMQIVNKVLTYMITLFLMTNWFTGYKIFENYIFKPMFVYIPEYLVDFKVDLNTIWDTLMSIPNLMWNITLYILSPTTFLISGWIILILLFMSMVLYIMTIMIFIRIGISILQIFIIALFSFITFPFNFMEKLSSKYGGVMIKTYLVLTIQYTILMMILKNLASMSKYVIEDILMSNMLVNILFAPIMGFIIVTIIFLLIRFTNKIIEIVANISHNM